MNNLPKQGKQGGQVNVFTLNANIFAAATDRPNFHNKTGA
jgi:hypothetical protein